MKKIDRAKNTIQLMISTYCELKRHSPDSHLCHDCEELLNYALSKLDKCPKGEKRKGCRRCEIHCYSPEMRQRIREVMRYMGPRWIFILPYIKLRNFWRAR